MEKTAAQKEEELEQLLSKFGAHENARDAVASLPPGEGVKLLRELHSAGKTTFEEEVGRRQEEFAQAVDEALAKNPSPPYNDELVGGLLGLVRVRVMPELFPKMDEVTASLRAKLAGKSIEDEQAAMVFQMAVSSLSLEFHKLLQQELVEECKSRDIEIEKFLEKAMPRLVGDASFFAELSHLNSLGKRDKLATAASRDTVVRYIRRSNAYSSMLLKGRISPQIAMVFPSIVEVFLFNEFGVEFVAVEAFVADFLERLPAEPAPADGDFLELLFEEVFLCQKVQELMMAVGQSQMEMMQQMFENGGMAPEQVEQMRQMFSPENMEKMKEMMGSLDPEQMAQMMGGMDPAHMAQMMGGMDPQQMAQMMGGMDPAQMMGGMDPAHMAQMMGGMDPAQMAQMMGGIDPAQMMELMGDMDHARMAQMMPDMQQFMQAMGGGAPKPFLPPR